MNGPTILDFMATLPWFQGDSWGAWRVLLAAMFALPLRAEEIALYSRMTGRSVLPATCVREGWLLLGRRSGKTIIAALVIVFLAALCSYVNILAPGERGVVMCIAPDRRQAKVLLRYISAIFDRVPALAALIERRTQDAIYLTTGIVIEVHTASFRVLRGYTAVAAVVDEVCFLRNEESANPDTEILNALRPAMATVPNALLLCISSPYARRGAAWEAYRTHWGKDASAVLIANADTRTMNPTVPEDVIREAYERDEASAAAEYGAEFRKDVETFVTREALEAVIVAGRCELPSLSTVRYVGFVDPSGGSQDSMTLAIAHVEDRGGRSVGVLDVVREMRPPFSPAVVVKDFASLLRGYGITSVTGDRYGGEWPRERFREHGIQYEVAETSKSDLYREVLPLLNSGGVELLDHPRLLLQLAGLERRTARGGRDSIDHAPNGHDDVANAVAGALVMAATKPALEPVKLWGGGDDVAGSARIAGAWFPRG